MRTRLFAFLLVSLTISFADPRSKVTDYPAHAESTHLDIGAEYLVHSFSNGRQSFMVPSYLVLDVAVYPHGLLTLKQNHFRLVLNGQNTLVPQDANMVSYSLKNLGSLDNGQGTQQFPGDRRGGAPPPAQAPDPAHPERDAQEDVETALLRTSLPEGEFHGPQSGYVYFPFEGKTKKIKSLDLIYKDGPDELTVRLF